MTPNALVDEILRLPPDQRLKLVEDVWDSLAASPHEVGVPQWHRDELDRRLADPSDQANSSWQNVRRAQLMKYKNDRRAVLLVTRAPRSRPRGLVPGPPPRSWPAPAPRPRAGPARSALTPPLRSSRAARSAGSSRA